MLLELAAFFEQPARIAGLGVLALIFVGVALRRKRKIHPPIMITCFVLDLSLVAYLELTRNAIAEAGGRLMEPEMLVHILLATLSLVLYGILIFTGRKVLRGAADEASANIQRFHRNTAMIFLVVRICVLITAIMVSKPQ